MLKIPQYAKVKARKALELRKQLPQSKKFGINKNEARKLGINSGVERAKQIVNNKTLRGEDVEAVCKFKRWLGRERTQKVQGAIDLWGGEKFIKKACKYKNRRKFIK